MKLYPELIRYRKMKLKKKLITQKIVIKRIRVEIKIKNKLEGIKEFKLEG
jgi:hypothetical protein